MISAFFNFGEDRIPEGEVVASISADVEFKGPKLWLLILAILLASLGLNINSTAVIIGAMLISPLMGPILGLGLGIAIYDFSLIKRSAINFFTATIFSILTATLYFSITPITQAQSELLARTSPTIYDVGIALCGGLAGIIALCCKSQRFGNVIPGVAIATALMPPLCTVGYGLATFNGKYAAGALYLYLINTVFITFGTAIFIAFILKFKKKTMVDKVREKRLRKIILSICIATIIPSIFLTFGIVQKTIFEQRANSFVQKEMNFENSQVVRYKADAETRTIQVLMLGQNLDSSQLAELKSILPSYSLKNVELNIIQGDSGMKRNEMMALLSNFESQHFSSHPPTQTKDKVTAVDAKDDSCNILSLEEENIAKEMHMLFPCISQITMAKGVCIMKDSCFTASPVFVLNLNLKDNISQKQKEGIKKWLGQKIGVDGSQLEVEFIVTKEYN